MQTVEIQTDDTALSRLIDAATAGEDVVFARDGQPVARLMPVPPRPKVIFGLLAGKLGPLLEAIDAPLPDDLLDLFDRLLVAQAIDSGARLITADRLLPGYSDLVTLIEPSRPA
jgi:antitoxin (DNA-binding transcriptional repressor) of toxin-antitoxin stability system